MTLAAATKQGIRSVRDQTEAIVEALSSAIDMVAVVLASLFAFATVSALVLMSSA